jgi:uncharacterized membrane protein
LISLTAIVFGSPDGAPNMLDLIEELSNNEAIIIEDLAMVIWEAGSKHPKTKQINERIAQITLSDAFWGLLFSKIFFVPSFGMGVAAAMGSLDGKFSGYGISRTFTKQVQNQVKEGSSALFSIASDKDVKGVTDLAKSKGFVFQIISTNLSKEGLERLQNDFGVSVKSE